jgi:Do/DeqQ family serine protease
MYHKKSIDNNRSGFLHRFIVLLFAYILLNAVQVTAFERENAVVKAVKAVAPAVVNINSEQQVRTSSHPFSGFGIDPFFDSFFKDFFDPGYERRYQRTSLGSGVIIDGERGFILTNEHVTAKAGKINVVLQDEREFEAQIIGADPDSDLAVLKIESAEPLPSIEMGSDKDLMIGESVIAIGNPFGFSHTVTTGVISALNRNIRTEKHVYRDFIQTDASINPGNSGGPLLDINGELIGINTAVYAKAQGIGFAIPINKAQKIINDLIHYGEVIPAWIGITVQDIDDSLATYLKIPTDNRRRHKGVMVKAVQAGSPAQKSGIKKGDIFLSIENKNLFSIQDYQLVMREVSAGDEMTASVWRDGSQRNFLVKTSTFPEDLAAELATELMGIEVENISAATRRKYHINADSGVVITKLKTGYQLSNIGAQPGDIIRQIDDQQVKTKADYHKAMVKYRQKSSVVVLLQRDDQLYSITIKL